MRIFILISTVLLVVQFDGINSQACPGGVPRVDCSVFPTCATVSCPAKPNAVCSQDPCSGCRALFRIGSVILSPKDCALATPDERCSANTGSTSGCSASAVDGCKSSHDCAPGSICCLSGCIHVCVPEGEPATTGSCPAPAGGTCTSSCQSDSDCVRGRKCCSNGCGRSCMTPVIDAPKQCPDGSTQILCRNPCEVRTCMAHPNAKCRPNYCGGCNAEFYDNQDNLITDCDYLGPECSNCLYNPCSTNTCKAFPDAECTPMWCENCQARFTVGGSEPNCDQECAPCPNDPCAQQTCEAVADATCVANNCDCTFEFQNNQGEAVECTVRPPDPQDDESRCQRPDGTSSVLVKCSFDPCANAECLGNSKARCRPNYCGECSAVFYENDNPVDCSVCADGKRAVACGENFCANTNCPAHRNAICRPDPCNSCEVEWFVNGNKIRNVDCIVQETCSPSDVVPCESNCLGRSCPNHPNAECVINSCRSCSVKFYDKNRNELSATDCGLCPDWSFNEPCPEGVNPCSVQCASNPNAVCTVKTCGGCRAEYRDNRGRLVDCDQCRSGGLVPETCARGLCQTKKCPAVDSAECRVDPCNNCAIEYFAEGVKLRDVDCIVQETCRNSDRVSNCGTSANCLGRRCDKRAECVVNNCRTCTAKFYDENRKELTAEECGYCDDWQTRTEANCPDSMCSRGCAAYPEATCTVQKCPCREVYRFNGNVVNCNRCSNGNTPCTRSRNACDSAECPAKPAAVCKVNVCNNCAVEWFENDQKIRNSECVVRRRCSDGSLPLLCDAVDNCRNRNCPAKANAVCQMNDCKTCAPEWFVGTRKIPDSDCVRKCSNGALPRKCTVDYCKSRTCPANDKAVCKMNDCRGCAPEWFVNDKAISFLSCIRRCPSGSLPLRCFFNRCRSRTCPDSPNAVCKMNDCGGCAPEWFLNGKKIPESACNKLCPNGKRPVRCSRNNCRGKTCPGRSAAVCKMDRCNKCVPEWFVDGKKIPNVDCVENKPCAPGQRLVKCRGDCLGRVCPGVSGAKCVIRGCDRCTYTFYDANLNALTADDCGVCKDWSLPRSCSASSCSAARCPGVSGARCRADRCDNCKVAFYHPTTNRKLSAGDCAAVDTSGKPGTCPEPRGRTKQCRSYCTTDDSCRGAMKCCPYVCGKACRTPIADPDPPKCPNGLSPEVCGQFECLFAPRCAAYPNAQCQADPCNFCQVDWKVNGRSVNCDAGQNSGSCPAPSGTDFFLCSRSSCSSDSDCNTFFSNDQKCCYITTCGASKCVDAAVNSNTGSGGCNCNDPCTSGFNTCLAPGATCFNDCCTARWYGSNGQLLTDAQCFGIDFFNFDG